MSELLLVLLSGFLLAVLVFMLGGVIIFFKLLVGLLGWWVMWLPAAGLIFVVTIFIYLWKESH